MCSVSVISQPTHSGAQKTKTTRTSAARKGHFAKKPVNTDTTCTLPTGFTIETVVSLNDYEGEEFISINPSIVSNLKQLGFEPMGSRTVSGFKAKTYNYYGIVVTVKLYSVLEISFPSEELVNDFLKTAYAFGYEPDGAGFLRSPGDGWVGRIIVEGKMVYFDFAA